VKIKFSRHAKRRIKLYKISESAITKLISKAVLRQGKQEIIENIHGVELPIKVVFNVTGNDLIVITAYPLKKGKK